MGVETAIIAALAISTGVSVGSQVAGGVAANKAAKREASLISDQGKLAQNEAQEEAGRRATEVRKFSKTQKLAFLKSGVTLEGSPLLVLEETLTEGQKEVDAISRSGTAQRQFAERSAGLTRSRGRAALISGFAGAASSATQAVGIGATSGLFGGKGSK